MAGLRRLGLFACLWIALTGAVVTGVSAQQGAQPQFKSGGLQVVVNRAVLNPAGGLVMSLVVTNPRDDNIEMFIVELPEAITDVGVLAVAERVSGLPVCEPMVSYIGRFAACVPDPDRVGRKFTPTIIDGGNSITVTISFRTAPNSKICSLDFSTLAGVRRAGGRSKDPWQQITIGLPNIKVC